MSTRCTVQIYHYGDLVASLYRHMDGYPAETGADIVETLRSNRHVSQFTRALLGETYEQAAYETKPRHIYSIGGVPGDIEHYYRIDFSDGEFFIHYAARDGWYDGSDNFYLTPTKYIVLDFISIVNKERLSINRNIATTYPEAELYPMIDDHFYPVKAG